MKFSYEDLISGDSIPVEGVGHIRSPFLKEIKPTQGIGLWTYHSYINILAWDKKDFLNFMRISTHKKLKALEHYEQLNAFDTITILEQTRNILQEALSFFIDENLEWDRATRSFITQSKNNLNPIGCINRDNFDDVRDMMLQMNYISLGQSTKPTKFSGKRAQRLWEKAQSHLKQEAKRSSTDGRTSLGNIISKLSCASVGYTLLNIYELTVFQLYDQFFQYGYLRAMDLNEMAYSNHGGKDFDIQAWLKPITNFRKEQK